MTDVNYVIYRLEFQVNDDCRAPEAERIETLEVEHTIPEILELVGAKYGGGAFRLDLRSNNRVLSSQPFEIAGKPKKINRSNIFKPVINRWYDEITDSFGENMYADFMGEFEKHGVDDFLEFLHHAHCTYRSSNKFLVECLRKAQDYGWDT